jgi:hypothetical protein
MANTGEQIFSPNSSINAAIKEMLPYFSSESQRRMRKKILEVKKAADKQRNENTDSKARNIFREFIPAFILNQRGFTFEYEKPMQEKTPDWVDNTARIMLESYTYERGGITDYINRVSAAVSLKCNRYKDIIVANSLWFVVAVYLDFYTSVLLEQCQEDSEMFRSVFEANNSLSAILFFSEEQDGYRIHKQNYGFFCLCADSHFETIPNWPFSTIRLN